jgi:hypothetical protein
VTDKTSREILDGIDAAIKETAALAAAGKLDVVAGMLGPVLPPLPARSSTHGVTKSSQEILDGIAKALEETRSELAKLEIEETPRTEGGN